VRHPCRPCTSWRQPFAPGTGWPVAGHCRLSTAALSQPTFSASRQPGSRRPAPPRLHRHGPAAPQHSLDAGHRTACTIVSVPTLLYKHRRSDHHCRQHAGRLGVMPATAAGGLVRVQPTVAGQWAEVLRVLQAYGFQALATSWPASASHSHNPTFAAPYKRCRCAGRLSALTPHCCAARTSMARCAQFPVLGVEF
jgi:hypothetical protein